MVRIVQFRDYEETTTFILEKYNEEVVDAIKKIKQLTLEYPWKVYFDFEIENIVENKMDYVTDIKQWYYEHKCGLFHNNHGDNVDEIDGYLKVLYDFYKFD